MQMPIANIITNSNKIDFVFKYNKCKCMEGIDNSLPTLIIGYDNAKKYIKNFDILQKYYPDQNVWWTFKKTEKRYEYENDMISFNKFIINNIIYNIKYKLIDIINIDRTSIIKLVKYILNNNNKLIYNIYNKFLLIYDKKLNIVYGLSLSSLRYFGYSDKKVLKFISKNVKNKFITDMDVIPVEIRRQIASNIHYQLCLYEYFS